VLSHLYTSIYIYEHIQSIYTHGSPRHIYRREGLILVEGFAQNKNRVAALYCRMMMMIIIIIIHRLRFCSDHSPLPPLVEHNSIPSPSL